MFFLFNIYTSWCFAQIPIDNPYKTKYKVEDHWTDSLKWGNVIIATNVKGLIDENRNIDSLVIRQTLQSISEKGGGVLFFPQGIYFFSFDLYVYDGVIIRGEDPINDNAKSNDYEPLTKFIFPKYEPIFYGNGTSNHTAFKAIFADFRGVRSVGIVNIDINRARIDFYNCWGDSFHDKTIIFGVRQNNVATSDPSIPSKIQRDENHNWQRWPFFWKENIVICVKSKGVIANCRLNDRITDNFHQPNYMTNDGYFFKDSVIKFRYDYHNAITVYNKEGLAADVEVVDNYILLARKFEKLTIKGNARVEENILIDNLDDPESNLITRWDNLAIPNQADTTIFEDHAFISSSKAELRYKLLKPKLNDKSKKYPLVVFFHGAGEKGYDQNPLVHFVPQVFCKEAILENFPCFVVVPHLNKEQHWVSNDGSPSEAIKATINLVKEIKKNYNINKRQIYAIGISDGANGVWEALIRYPNLFASGVPIGTIKNFSIDDINKIQKKSIWLSAGITDPHIPIKYVRFMNQQLKNANINVIYNEYADIGHFSWVPIYDNKDFLPWLFAQNR